MEPVNRIDTSECDGLRHDLEKLQSENDLKQQIILTDRIKRSLCRKPEAGSKAIMKLDIVPIFMRFLKQDNEHLLINSAAIITSLMTTSLMTEGHSPLTTWMDVIPFFLPLLHSQYKAVKRQSICSFGNFSETCETWRDFSITQGVPAKVLKVLSEDTEGFSTKAASYCLSQLCAGDLPDAHRVVPVLSKLLFHADNEVVQNTCRGVVNYLNSGSAEMKMKIKEVMKDHGLFKQFVELLNDPFQSEDVIQLSLAVVTKLVETKSEMQVIADSLLPKLSSLLSRNTSPSLLVALKIIEQFSFDQPSCEALSDANIISALIHLLDAEFDATVVGTTIKIISNIINNSNPTQIQELEDAGCMQSLLNSRVKCSPTEFSIATSAAETILARRDDYVGL